MHATQPETTSILITGAAGFLGQALTQALLQENPSAKIILTDVVKPKVPEHSTISNIRSLAADLTIKDTCDQLLTNELTDVYLLHGIMSGAAESNYDLGLRVNVDSMRHIAESLRNIKRGHVVKVVFPSSLAVFGPADNDTVVTEETRTAPRSSYGAEKAMTELLFDDLSRRGHIDARIVRLPTIIVRPGQPSGAASSFCSGIIREPLNKTKSTLPVHRNTKLWVCSTRTVVRNLVSAKNIPSMHFGSGSRIVNLPGQTVTVKEMLQALIDVGGKETAALVEDVPDQAVENIVGSWPAVFDISKADGLGFEGDVTLIQIIRDYMEDFM
ncbi:hypothetical protein E4T48_06057 [Aureobasidium sp. EXF-10727]|nr:hypothetical protein E4T48_06057 [Aureobasidium sp. EXF-10727]